MSRFFVLSIVNCEWPASESCGQDVLSKDVMRDVKQDRTLELGDGLLLMRLSTGGNA